MPHVCAITQEIPFLSQPTSAARASLARGKKREGPRVLLAIYSLKRRAPRFFSLHWTITHPLKNHTLTTD